MKEYEVIVTVSGTETYIARAISEVAAMDQVLSGEATNMPGLTDLAFNGFLSIDESAD